MDYDRLQEASWCWNCSSTVSINHSLFSSSCLVEQILMCVLFWQNDFCLIAVVMLALSTVQMMNA